MKFFLSFSLFFLFTTSLFAQIPDGYYDGTDDLEGEALVDALHDIIDNHDEYSYDDLRDFLLRETDEDPDNPNNVILLYTGRSQPKSTFGGGADDWNREHVWAKSHGDFGNTPPAGTDAHHIRPTDASVNSSRGNLDFDNGGSQHSEATGCYFDNNSWEPRDEVKGDVARMIFYMEVRYDGSDGMPVSFVTEGKPAAIGGMKGGDIITAVDGKRVGNVHDYMERLSELEEGQSVIVTVKRDGSSIDLLLKL